MTPSILRPLLRRLPALLLVVTGAWFAGLSSAHAEFRLNNLWWTPEAVTKNGHQIDFLLNIIFGLTLLAFIATQVVYVYFIVKYRHRKGVKAVYSHGNNTLEIVWTTIPAAIFILLAVYSDKLWFELRDKAPADALRLDIVAYQFGFHVRNPGQDGKLEKFSQEWMSKEKDNVFGVDKENPSNDARDDYQSENLLTIPINRPCNVSLRSLDVIHAFYVPEFRMYQDIVPGRLIDWVTFTPEKVGHYSLACNQLCGSGHYNMQAQIEVVSQEDYAALVKKSSRGARKTYDKAHGRPEGAPDTLETADVAPTNPQPAVALEKP